MSDFEKFIIDLSIVLRGLSELGFETVYLLLFQLEVSFTHFELRR